MTKIKICGLKSKEDISYVNELLPEYAGFVFASHQRCGGARQLRPFGARLCAADHAGADRQLALPLAKQT